MSKYKILIWCFTLKAEKLLNIFIKQENLGADQRSVTFTFQVSEFRLIPKVIIESALLRWNHLKIENLR